MKLEIKQRKRNEKKKLTTWRLNNMLLKNLLDQEEIKMEFKTYLETNDNEDTTIQNLLDTHKVEGSIPGLVHWVKDLALP